MIIQFYFFFQAEDGIRDGHVTGVQTCALPIAFFGEVNELEGEVRNGKLQTPVGSVDARQLPEGSRALVLIRPEALRVTERSTASPEHRYSHVIMAKLLGRSSLVHICAHGEDG